MKIIDFTGREVEIKSCMGCEIVNGDIDVFSGLLFKGNYFTVAQDFELPIEGFIIITSIRHVEKFIELTKEERLELIDIIYKVLRILEEHNIAEEYNIILEEKSNHFHVWLMPRHKWMIEKFGKV